MRNEFEEDGGIVQDVGEKPPLLGVAVELSTVQPGEPDPPAHAGSVLWDDA